MSALCQKQSVRSSGPMSLRARVLFLTENSEEDYRDYEQHNKIHLPCWSETNSIGTGHGIQPYVLCACDYTRDWRPAEWGLTFILRDKNPRGRMSALGQEQTWKLVRVMSALPPKADIGTQSWNVRFVPKADHCGARSGRLLFATNGLTVHRAALKSYWIF